MGYPTAYRTAAARAAFRGPILLVPIRTRAPSPTRAQRSDWMRNITEIAEIPPYGINPLDIIQAVRLFGRLARFHPWSRVLDLWELLRSLQQPQRVTTPGQTVPTGWVECWTCSTGQPPLAGALRIGGIAGFGIPCGSAPGPSTCGSFGTFTPADFTIHGVISIQDQHPFVSTFPIVAGIYTAPVPQTHPPEILQNPQPRLIDFPLFDPLARWRWVDPHLLTPIHRPAPDPEPPPVWAPEPWTRGREVGNEDPAPAPHNIYVENPQTWPLNVPTRGRRRPGPKTREKKFRATRIARALEWAVTNAAFLDGKLKDLRDLLKALNDALPDEFKLKGKDAKKLDKLMLNLYFNIDKLGDSVNQRTIFKGTPWERKISVSQKADAYLNVLEEIAEDLFGGFGDSLRDRAARQNRWFKTKIFTGPRF